MYHAPSGAAVWCGIVAPRDPKGCTDPNADAVGKRTQWSWPGPEALNRFIERNRCRVPGRGLFVIEDGNRRVVGMVQRHDANEGELQVS